MTITNQLFIDAFDTTFEILDGLLDDVVITRKGEDIYDSATGDYTSGDVVALTTKGSLENRRIRLDTGVDTIEEVLTIKLTNESDMINTTDNVTVNGIKYSINGITKNKVYIELTLGGA